MTPSWSALAEPAPRLFEAAWMLAGPRAIDPARVGVVGTAHAAADAVTPCAPNATIERWLVLSWIGAHPDARDPLLAALWALEEAARATGLPTLVLRLAPLVGPRSPLLALLRDNPKRDARLDRRLVQPVLEADVVAGLAKWIDGSAVWGDWFEVCGPDALSVGELIQLTQAGHFGALDAAPAWEPSPAVLRSQGLSEWEAWALATGVTPRSILTPQHAGQA